MSRHKISSFLVTCILLILQCPSFSQEFTPLVELDEPVPLVPGSFGFNTSFMFNDAAVNTGGSTILDPEVNKPIADLGPKVLRFPGGTIANYYHYGNTGYGVKWEDLPNFQIFGQIFRDDDFEGDFIHPFTELALEQEASVLYVLNLRSHFLPLRFGPFFPAVNNNKFKALMKENLDALEHLMDSGVKVVGVEMGNELYLDNLVTSRITQDSLSGFIELCRIYADSIRKRWPDIKIGMQASHPHFKGDFGIWNKVCSRVDFADAMIVHLYVDPLEPFCGTDGGRDTFYDCASGYLEEYFDNEIQFIEETYLPELTASGKKIWITEWNINKPSASGNTFFQASYVFRFMHTLTQINARLGNPIEFMIYHHLFSSGSTYPNIGVWQGREADSIRVHDKFTYKAPFYANMLFKEIFEESYSSVPSYLLDPGGVESYVPGFNQWAYWHSENDLMLCWQNNGPEAVELLPHDLEVAGMPGMRPVRVTLSYVRAEKPGSFAGNTSFNLTRQNIGNQFMIQEDVDIPSSGKISIPPNTLAVLKVELDETLPEDEEPPVEPDTASTELLSFYAETDNCSHNIYWVTGHEPAGTRFRLSRLEGSTYKLLTQVMSPGAYHFTRTYSVKVNDLLPGFNDYKLEILENGLVTGEDFTTAYNPCEEDESQLKLATFPGITANSLYLFIDSPGHLQAGVIISHAVNGIIHQDNIQLIPGSNTFYYSMQNLAGTAGGPYVVTLVAEGQVLNSTILYVP